MVSSRHIYYEMVKGWLRKNCRLSMPKKQRKRIIQMNGLAPKQKNKTSEEVWKAHTVLSDKPTI